MVFKHGIVNKCDNECIMVWSVTSALAGDAIFSFIQVSVQYFLLLKHIKYYAHNYINKNHKVK